MSYYIAISFITFAPFFTFPTPRHCSHSFGEQFSKLKWAQEIAGQREIMSAYGGVRMEDIRGMRAPFLSVSNEYNYFIYFTHRDLFSNNNEIFNALLANIII